MAAIIESLVHRILECDGIGEKNERFIAVKDNETYDIVQSEGNVNTVHKILLCFRSMS
jgi:hypothetical protein